jgi:hypothetical protein
VKISSTLGLRDSGREMPIGDVQIRSPHSPDQPDRCKTRITSAHRQKKNNPRSQVGRKWAAEPRVITMFFRVAMGEGQQNQRDLEFVLTIQIPSLKYS